MPPITSWQLRSTKGPRPQAELAAAQGYFAEGNVKQAQTFANRALTKLPRGSPEWIRAEDIAKYKEPPTDRPDATRQAMNRSCE